jgi:hypothetical protein
VSEERVGKAPVLGFGIFSRPLKRLCTRDQAGALHTEAVRRKLSVGREVKTEILGEDDRVGTVRNGSR